MKTTRKGGRRGWTPPLDGVLLFDQFMSRGPSGFERTPNAGCGIEYVALAQYIHHPRSLKFTFHARLHAHEHKLVPAGAEPAKIPFQHGDRTAGKCLSSA